MQGTSWHNLRHLAAGIFAPLRKHARPRQTAPEETDNEYLLRMGVLAAIAAHELRSPLTTMAVLVDELRRRPEDDHHRVAESLHIVSDQIEACREILAALTAQSRDELLNDRRIQPVDSFVLEMLARWRLLRPGVELELRCTGAQPAARVCTAGGLAQAILNLLDNAADASPHAVEMEYACHPGRLRILVQDRGPGIPADLKDMLGKPFFTTKREKGMGIGLLLAKTVIDRAGGSLTLANRAGSGACAEVILPLEANA